VGRRLGHGARRVRLTTDSHGRHVVADRFHWVVCEAIATAAVLGDEERCRRARAFAEAHLIDDDRGGWRHELDPENRPAARTWNGRPDVYHALQATLIPGLPIRPSVAGVLR
jgi:sulfoquinovose isomerase